MQRLFLVVLLAALNATASSQEFTTPFKPAGEQLPNFDVQSLLAPFRSTPVRLTPLDWFTPAKCPFIDAIDCVRVIFPVLKPWSAVASVFQEIRRMRTIASLELLTNESHFGYAMTNKVSILLPPEVL